jgi:flagellar biosynthetic protein FliR
VIAPWVLSFSLVLARVGTLVTVMPLFGGSYAPRTVRVGLAVALSLLWFDFSLTAASPLLNPSTDITWLAYGLALAREAVVGIVLGYTLSLFLVPAQIAGEFITQEMGLSLGSIIDPSSGNPNGVVTQIFQYLAILVFFAVDGHHTFLAILHASFQRWPIGGAGMQLPISNLVRGAAVTEEWGLLLAAPLGICLFLTSVVLAMMARAAPQMNIFSVGFALRVGTGLVGALFLVPDLITGMVRIFNRCGELLLGLT